MTIATILQSRTGAVFTASADELVEQVTARLAEQRIGALPVVDGQRVIGIFSERDYARKGILKARRAHETLVSELMSSPLITVLPDQPMEDCMQLMTERHIRHLPVMDGEELVGMVTIGDVVMHTIRQQQSTIEQLEGYIIGKY